MTRKHTPLVAGATAAITMIGALVLPGAAGAATAKRIPVVTVHLGTGKSVGLSRTHLSAGRVTFAVHSAKDHTLQIAKLHKGYTLGQANQDIGAGFGGSAAAISRVDKNVTFNGGVEAKKGKPGRMTIYLPDGKYMAVNFDTGVAKSFTVSGSNVNRRTVATNSRIKMLTYGFDTRPVLARSGTMRLSNVSDQPHFIVLQRVKQSTTHRMVAKAFKSESDSKPKFALKGGIDSGVLSPNKGQAFSYKLPAGKYVMACFWPDDKTGMEHAEMGMFKLVQLR